MPSQPHSSSGVRGKRCFQSLIGRTLPRLARCLCPHRSPVSLPSQEPLPTLLLLHPPPPSLFQKSRNRLRDPRWKSNSINQIIAQHAVGIPTSPLHANEAGKGCGKGGRDGAEGVCATVSVYSCVLGERFHHSAIVPRSLPKGE